MAIAVKKLIFDSMLVKEKCIHVLKNTKHFNLNMFGFSNRKCIFGQKCNKIQSDIECISKEFDNLKM